MHTARVLERLIRLIRTSITSSVRIISMSMLRQNVLKFWLAVCVLWGLRGLVQYFSRESPSRFQHVPVDIPGLRQDTTETNDDYEPLAAFSLERSNPRTSCILGMCSPFELCQSESNVLTGGAVPTSGGDHATIASFRLANGLVKMKLRWSFTFALNAFSSPVVLSNHANGLTTNWVVISLGEEGSEDVFNADSSTTPSSRSSTNGSKSKQKLPKLHTHRGYVVLLSMETGETRWCTEPLKAGRSNELFGTPAVLEWRYNYSPRSTRHANDADQALAATLVVGGRGGQLHGLDSLTGRLLWTWSDKAPSPVHVRELNWFSACVTPDLDGDGVADFINTYSGDHNIPKCVPSPGLCLRRPPGFLVVVSGRTGEEISRATVPDERESYMSPMLYCAQKQKKQKQSIQGDANMKRTDLEDAMQPCVEYTGDDGVAPSYRVVLGTGGESIGGSLWVVPLRTILAGTMQDAVEIVQPMPGPHQTPQGGTGMVAPPALADLNNDGVLDIVHAAFNGRVGATDGLTLKSMWSVSMTRPYESWTFAAPAVGRMVSTDALDVFAVVNGGHWFEPGPNDPPDAKPDHVPAKRVMLDGRTGKKLWENAPGNWPVYCSVGSSPLTADLDGDGLDEVVYFLGALHVGSAGGDDRAEDDDHTTMASAHEDKRTMMDEEHEHDNAKAKSGEKKQKKRGPFCMDTDLIVLSRHMHDGGGDSPVLWEERVVAHFENAIVPSTPVLVLENGVISMIAALSVDPSPFCSVKGIHGTTDIVRIDLTTGQKQRVTWGSYLQRGEL